jgi:hypothetical protein
MRLKIQKPTVCRMVEVFIEVFSGHSMRIRCPAVITEVFEDGVVSVYLCDPDGGDQSNSLKKITYDDGDVLWTWRYPPRCTEEIEVDV